MSNKTYVKEKYFKCLLSLVNILDFKVEKKLTEH